MLLDFNEIKEITVPGMNNGTGMMTAKMYMDDQGKIIPCGAGGKYPGLVYRKRERKKSAGA